MPTVVIDSDILIHFLRGDPKVKDFLERIASQSVPCCSAITVAEIHAGMRSSEKEGTKELLDSLVILPVTREIAELAGNLKQSVRHMKLALDDCLIAATALIEEVPLATGNRRHYPFAKLVLL
ncbi:MAG: type II toxin-antitoxin system VapC family toxin [Deltaproteobacteria bacterium]|nr:type II toxin-antitoxin system VapC family toxin [Deltaproteobacteria bacterium]